MTSVQTLLQRQEVLIVLVLSILVIAMDRYLLHRRLMKGLSHQLRSSEDLEIPASDFPTLSIGILLTGIGLGTVLEVILAADFQGGFIFLCTGILFIVNELSDKITNMLSSY